MPNYTARLVGKDENGRKVCLVLGRRPRPCPPMSAYTASRGPAAAAVEELCEMGDFLSCRTAQIVQLSARNFMEDDMYKVYADYDDARHALEEDGGWLLESQCGSGAYIVTDDQGVVEDMLGADYVAKCERLQVWDQTIVDRHRMN